MINDVILKDLSNEKKAFLYRVEVGDSLKTIADRFHTTQRVLVVVNGLESCPKVGEYLIVEKVDGVKYVTSPLDTLEKIANNNHEKIQEIKIKNKIDTIYVGQKIYV
ncbi:MAG: LysM peptidoglycan-binding domain-containing protein [Clostridia bacterium]|nr:LysM peptidoglycan-binding domain-containing protein [Clostridia bacterium]